MSTVRSMSAPTVAGAFEPDAVVSVVDAASLEQATTENRANASHGVKRIIRIFMSSPKNQRCLLIRAEKAEHGYDEHDKKCAQSLHSDAPLQPSPRTHRPEFLPIQSGHQPPPVQRRQHKHCAKERELERHQPPVAPLEKHRPGPAEKIRVMEGPRRRQQANDQRSRQGKCM